MNLDFLILVTIYLAIILAFHYKLKNYSKSTILKDQSYNETELGKNTNNYIDTEVDEESIILNERNYNDLGRGKKSNTNVDSELDEESIIIPTEEELIINPEELDNITDNASTDFLKYLKVEENDNNEIYRKLSDSMDINLTKNVQSLDCFFPEKKEEYTFNDVSTTARKDTLMGDVSNLNIGGDLKGDNNSKGGKNSKGGNIFDQVYAFDEFNDSYALI